MTDETRLMYVAFGLVAGAGVVALCILILAAWLLRAGAL